MDNQSMYSLIRETLISVKDRNILSYFNRIMNNDEVLDRIDRMAFYLSSKGIGKGDVVAVCLPNIPNAIFAIYAINKCGAIANLIHPLIPALGLKTIIENTNSKLLIYLDSFYIKGMDVLSDVDTILCNVADDMPIPLQAIVRLKIRKDSTLALSQPNTTSVKECFANKGEVKVSVDSEDISTYLHSGGTTGSPKVIKLSNRALNACATKTGSIIDKITGNTDAMLMVLPLFHGFGLGVAMHTCIYIGTKVVLMPKFTPKEAVKTIKKANITHIAGVPQMYSKIMDVKGFRGRCVAELKNVYCGGDKLPKNTKNRWDCVMKQNDNDIEILEGYGLTEMVTVSHVNVPNAHKSSSVGKPLDGICHKIIDSKGQALPPNESGEICLAGSTMMSGYLNDEETTNEIIKKDENGVEWLMTGDCGYIDEDGFLFFRERIKRMVKISGINVFPKEIEFMVSSLEEVKYACALEIDYYGKTAIKLYLVLNNDIQLTSELENYITKYIADRLMKYSVPRVIEQCESLPVTMVGKVDYRALYEQEKAKGNLEYK